MGADIISAVEFDPTGEFLATGDKGGRMVLFERSHAEKSSGRKMLGGFKNSNPVEYKFYTEFQSHEPEFDYLKSLEIEEKINKIRWCRRGNNAHFLLSTNDKTVVTAAPKKVFSNAHAYHINSISVNTDGETYVSADDLRINLWNLEISDRCFNIVDIKPENMEELTEVITAAEFHPQHCNLLMYSSSQGGIKLADMRSSALCDQHAKLFESEEDTSSKSFFSEIVSSISDVKFSRDGRYILCRDYLTLKIWDINMEAKPVKTIQVQEYLRPKLCDLYESDCIFDKFECSFSNDGNTLFTGGYHNHFYAFDRTGKNDQCIEATKVQPKKKLSKKTFGRNKKGGFEVNVDTIDFEKKVLHMSLHPQENTIAVGTLNNLYIFSATK